MLRRALRGHPHARGLRLAHEGGRRRARHVQHVVAAAGASRELQVARDDRRFGLGRAARYPELGRPRALVHVPAADEIGVFGVLGEHRAGQRGRVLERVPHHLRIGDAVAVVGEDAHAEVVELPERRELLTAATLRDASRGPHVAQTDRAGAIEDRLHDRGIVDRRHRVRHAHHRGASAERGGTRTGLDRLRVFAAGLPEVHLDVDEPGRDHASLGVEDGRARSTARARHRPPRSHRRRRERRADRDPRSRRRPVHPGRATHRSTTRSLRQLALRSRGATTARPCVPPRRSRPAR